MTHEQKIEYMAIAGNICRFMLDIKQMDLLVSMYELVLTNEGQTDLRMISEVEAAINQRADLKRKQELLDAVSEKK